MPQARTVEIGVQGLEMVKWRNVFAVTKGRRYIKMRIMAHAKDEGLRPLAQQASSGPSM
jgi:hypothetical protein